MCTYSYTNLSSQEINGCALINFLLTISAKGRLKALLGSLTSFSPLTYYDHLNQEGT